MKFTTLLAAAFVIGTVSAGPIEVRGNDNNQGKGDGHGNGNGNGHGNGHGCRGNKCPPRNELFQHSVIAALVKGVAAGSTTIGKVLEHGDLGLGTFDSLVGEMIILDGVAYHAKADKSVTRPRPNTQTPLASITRFAPTDFATASIGNFSDFTHTLPSWFNTPVENHFVSYRVDGTFTLRIRAPGGQKYPLEPLGPVTERQTEWEYENLAGTMVGFRTPKYAGEINAAGDHLHFISNDRKIAGHVLEFKSVGNVKIKLAKITNYHVEVPGEGQFNQVSL